MSSRSGGCPEFEYSQPFWLERNGFRPALKQRLPGFVHIRLLKFHVSFSYWILNSAHSGFQFAKPGAAHTCGSVARAAYDFWCCTHPRQSLWSQVCHELS